MTDRRAHAQRLAMLLLVVGVVGACSSLDGRNRNRHGNKLYADGKFVDAVGEFEQALSEVDNPTIHYNCGLAYWKIFRAQYDKPIRLAKTSDEVCSQIPNTKPIESSVCVRDKDRHYDRECDPKVKDSCPALYTCETTTFCTIDTKTIADAAAKHFDVWIKDQASDEDLKKQQKAVEAEMAEVDAKLEKLNDKPSEDNKSAIARLYDYRKDLEKKLDLLHTKEQTRGIMTGMWIDSDQFKKALAYWTKLLDEKPNNPDIMSVLAGINLKANDWETSIEWYKKVADVSPETTAKVAAFQFIGNVAWTKLNSKSLVAEKAIKLADLGIGALQKASELAPENPRLIGLMGSLFSFRGMIQGASWASSIDRASTQDLQRASRVLMEQAKKSQGQAPPKGAADSHNPSSSGGKTGG